MLAERMIDLNDYRSRRPQEPPSLASALEAFRDAIEAAGLGRPEVVADGEIHRFDAPDRGRGNQYCWYVFHQDKIPAGAFGAWHTDISENWCSKAKFELSRDELDAINQRIEAARERKRLERQREADEAAAKARAVLETAPDATDEHPYLARKKVKAFNLKIGEGDQLLVPLYDEHAEIRGFERIPAEADQTKKLLKGTNPVGIFGFIDGDLGTLYVVEGYATGASVHMATGHAVAVARNAGNLEPVVGKLTQLFPQSRIVIAADNDQFTLRNGTPWNTGIEKANQAATAHGVEVVVPEFRSLDGTPTDFNDLHCREGLEAVRRQVDVTGRASRALEFLPIGEMLKEPRFTEWLIKDHVEAATLTVLFGESGAMKSFVALDIGLCIAAGIAWHGNEARTRGAVFYVAGEGFRGLPARLKAWCLANDVNGLDIPFFVSNRPAQFLDSDSAREVRQAVGKLIESHGSPRLLIVDTLSRCFGPAGDENSTADMTAFVNALDDIRIETGCAVMVVHHSGLSDKNRSRGSSVLRGALDFEYMLEKNADGTRTMHCKKAKDHEEPMSIIFKPETVKLGWKDAETGEEMTSCVLIKDRESRQAPARPKLSSANRIVLQLLVDAVAKPNENECIDLGRQALHVDDWRDLAYAASITTSSDIGAKQKAFRRAVAALIEKGYVGTENDYYWPL